MAGRGIALAALVGLGACAELQSFYLTETLRAEREVTAQLIAARSNSLGRPFADGALSVVPVRHGELSGFTLVPCGGTHACLGTAQGRRGHLVRVGEAVLVSGIHRGRTYVLEPGGRGEVRVDDGMVMPLAWDSVRPVFTGPANRNPGSHVAASD